MKRTGDIPSRQVLPDVAFEVGDGRVTAGQQRREGHGGLPRAIPDDQITRDELGQRGALPVDE
jgi:hypothetical protein